MEMLRVDSGKIVDAKGTPQRLRGTCVGGWMNMENFINGYPGAEHQLRAVMARRIGKEKAEFFFDRLLDHFFNESDVSFIKSLGATVVRLPVNYRHFESDEKPFVYAESGFTRLDKALAACEKHGLYVIIDLHAVQGWQNTDWHCDNATRHSLFWHNAHYQDRFVNLWEELARRYRGRAVVAGYNVMNEPFVNEPFGRFGLDYEHDWERINRVYRRVVAAIRKIDPDHIIFLEGDVFSSFFSGFDAPFAPNLVYSSHNYSGSGFGPGKYPDPARQWTKEHQAANLERHQGYVYARAHNVPLWVGEFGSVYNGPSGEIPDRLRAMDDQLACFNERELHWTTWTYKDIETMGIAMLEPRSEFVRMIRPSLDAKAELKCDQWQSWLPRSKSDQLIHELAGEVLRAAGDQEYRPDQVENYLRHAATACFAAGLLQHTWAKLFSGMSEEKIDSVLSAFELSNCVKNEGLITVLKRQLASTQ